jgi:YVTN family beta-propeller protein
MRSMRLILIVFVVTFFSQSIFSSPLSRLGQLSPKVNLSTPPDHWLGEFALTPDNKEIYAIDLAKFNVSIVEVSTGITRKILSFPSGINGLAFSLDGKKAYISNWSDSIFIVDTSTQEVIGKVASKPELPFVGPRLAISPTGSYLYAADDNRDNGKPVIHVIDTRLDKVIATIEKTHLFSNMGWPMAAFAFTHDASLLYISDIDNDIDVLRTTTNTLEESIFFCTGDVINIALSPAEDKLFVLAGVGNLCVFDTNTRQKMIEKRVSATIGSTLILSADGKKLYISARVNTVSVFDAATFTLIKTIPVGDGPAAMHFSSDGTQLYVINADSSTVSVIDTLTDNVIRTIPVVS